MNGPSVIVPAIFLRVPTVSFQQIKRQPWLLAWTLVGLAMLVLFGLWPYQHWAYSDRLSVLGGWWRTVGENDEPAPDTDVKMHEVAENNPLQYRALSHACQRSNSLESAQ
jgi:hypothetical protein